MTKHWVSGRTGAMIVLLSAVVAWAPSQLFGIIDSGDWHVHWFRLHGFSQALFEGSWRPYWHADANSGYGAPTFLFYPPLSYYLASVPVLSGLDIGGAWSLAYLAIFLITVFGGYRLFRLWCGPRASASVAALFVLSPPVLFNIYQMHMPANALAFAIIPWLLYAVLYPDKLWIRKVSLVAISTALLILAHPLIALQAALALAVLSSWLVMRGKNKMVLQTLAGGAMGLLISAWYWLPVMSLRDLIHWEFLLNPAWNWKYNVLFTRPQPPYGAFHDYRALFDCLAIVGLLLSVALLGAIWSIDKRSRSLASVLFVCGLVCFFVMCPAGTWLVKFVPPLGYLQFAWRWLGIQWLFMFTLLALLIGVVAIRRRFVFILPGAVASGMLLVSLAAAGVGPLSGKMGLKDEYVREARMAQAVREEYWPTLEMRPTAMGKSWNLKLNRDPMPPVWVHSGDLRVRSLDRGQHRLSISYESTRPSTIRLRHLNFPGWTARVGGEMIPIESERESGAMVFSVLPGSGEIVISYERPRWHTDG